MLHLFMNKPIKLSLYYYDACPFCRIVLQELAFLELAAVEKRNTMHTPAFRKELVEKGGSAMVPCLLIDEDLKQTWLYESRDIIKYLRQVA